MAKSKTFILTKLAPNANATAVYKDLCKVNSPSDINEIYRDEVDTRRFYVIFSTLGAKRRTLSTGFTTCGTQIKQFETNQFDFTGFIPYSKF